MIFEFTLGSIAIFLVGIFALILAVVIWMRRPSPGAVPFSLFLLAVVWWLFARILQASAIIFADKVIWALTTYFGIASAAIFWLAFALDFTGDTRWRRPRFFLLYVVPLFAIGLAGAARCFDLGYLNIKPSLDSTGFFIIWEHHPLFWLQMLYVCTLLVIGTIALWRFMLRSPRIFRRQIISLLIGTLVPVVSLILFAVGYFAKSSIDWLPLTFVLGGLIYSITIFRYRFLDIVPLARGSLVEKMPDGIVVLNVEGVIADLNPAGRQMGGERLRMGAAQRLGLVWPQLDILRQHLKDGQHTEIVINGEGEKYLDVSLTEIKERRGEQAGQLIVLRDITERRKIEQTLRESEARYEALVEQSNDGVMIIQEGEYRFANLTMEEISGYKVEEIIGKKLPLGIVDGEKVKVAELYKKRQTGEAVPSIFEIRLKRKDGEERDVEVNVGTIRYEGKPANIVTLRDVTERKQTQRKLEELYQEEKLLRGNLEEEIEKRSKYTRALVHELNTPLTSILASSELLELEVGDKTLQALVQNIRRSSRNLEQRISELIELARGEVGMLKINAMPLDIGELITEIVSEIKPVAEGKGLQIELELEKLPVVLGDRSRLRQVLANLTNNAIKYTAQGGVKVRGKVYDHDSVLVEVEDSGRGMKADEIEYLFDPYRRKVNDGQKLGGLGIGLALTKLFLDLHGGKIWVKSQAGHGTTFSFTVPVYKHQN
jgi:PAS domain S-box-containing protein